VDLGTLPIRLHGDGDEWVITGTKSWISNLGVADFYVVFAVTDHEHRRRSPTRLGVRYGVRALPAVPAACPENAESPTASGAFMPWAILGSNQ
jgi:hypothetical protein